MYLLVCKSLKKLFYSILYIRIYSYLYLYTNIIQVCIIFVFSVCIDLCVKIAYKSSWFYFIPPTSNTVKPINN